MKIKRTWCMPNKNTFEIKPIRQFIEKNIYGLGCDPFARNSNIADITNDINKNTQAKYNLDALEFLRSQKDEYFDYVLFDPPYSLRQLKECYDEIGKSLTQKETQYFFSDVRDQITRIIKPGGICLSFGWSSVGLGKSRGMILKEVLLVCHGGYHNDTICLKEVKQ